MAERKNNRAVGRSRETLAMQYLQQQGLQILERNYCCRQGEIDIVAREAPYLVFVEVKYRTTARNGYPAEAVTEQKQYRIRQAARYYQYQHHLPENTPIRFDVVAILGTKLEHIRNAF